MTSSRGAPCSIPFLPSVIACASIEKSSTLWKASNFLNPKFAQKPIFISGIPVTLAFRNSSPPSAFLGRSVPRLHPSFRLPMFPLFSKNIIDSRLRRVPVNGYGTPTSTGGARRHAPASKRLGGMNFKLFPEDIHESVSTDSPPHLSCPDATLRQGLSLHMFGVHGEASRCPATVPESGRYEVRYYMPRAG